jgi:hypothetical protein
MYICVDNSCWILQAYNPGIATTDSDGLVKNIVLQASEDISSLKQIKIDRIKVFKLRTPLHLLPYQPCKGVQHMTKHLLEEHAKA